MGEKIVIPDHVGLAGKKWIKSILEVVEVNPAHHESLFQAAGCLDRLASARRLIEHDGITIKDRFGQPKPHPATAIERDNKILFIKYVKEVLSGSEEVPTGVDPLLEAGFDL